jgi:hypothetical protein
MTTCNATAPEILVCRASGGYTGSTLLIILAGVISSLLVIRVPAGPWICISLGAAAARGVSGSCAAVNVPHASNRPTSLNFTRVSPVYLRGDYTQYHPAPQRIPLFPRKPVLPDKLPLLSPGVTLKKYRARRFQSRNSPSSTDLGICNYRLRAKKFRKIFSCRTRFTVTTDCRKRGSPSSPTSS